MARRKARSKKGLQLGEQMMSNSPRTLSIEELQALNLELAEAVGSALPTLEEVPVALACTYDLVQFLNRGIQLGEQNEATCFF